MSVLKSVHLLWQKEVPGALGISRHAVSDKGGVALSVHDPLTPRTYRLFHYNLHRMATGFCRADSEAIAAFTMETIRLLEFTPHPNIAVAITDKELYYLPLADGAKEQFPYMPGRGIQFLDASLAGADQRHTFAILLQDRAGISCSLTVAEGRENLVALWAKSWSRPLACVSASSNGEWFAVGHTNGSISLLDRARRVRWEFASAGGRGIAAIAVDCSGSVVIVDTNGEVRRHEPQEGAVLWRAWLVEQQPKRRSAERPTFFVAIDGQTRMVGVALAAPKTGEQREGTEAARYFLLDGATGDSLWEDTLSSPPTGIALSPSGEYMGLSTRSGDVALFWLVMGTAPAIELPASSGAPELLSQARQEAAEGHFLAALPLLTEALAADPTLVAAAALYEEICWHARESVMDSTTRTTGESLARVEEALLLMPHDEKLTMRRNALARILAAKSCERAGALSSSGKPEEAVAAYLRAIALDPTLSEARRGMAKAQLQQARSLLDAAQAARDKEQWEEATGLLEKARAICPGSADIDSALQAAKRDAAFAQGLRYYKAQRYHEAAFQFKRVLVFDPQHMEAVRHLNFAESFIRKSAEPEGEAPAAADRFQLLE